MIIVGPLQMDYSILSSFLQRRVFVLWSVLWPSRNRFMPQLYWGPQRWMQYSRWDLTRAEQKGESPPWTCWPQSFWCSPGYNWLSVLQLRFTGLCLIFHPPVSPSLRGCSVQGTTGNSESQSLWKLMRPVFLILSK